MKITKGAKLMRRKIVLCQGNERLARIKYKRSAKRRERQALRLGDSDFRVRPYTERDVSQN